MDWRLLSFKPFLYLLIPRQRSSSVVLLCQGHRKVLLMRSPETIGKYKKNTRRNANQRV
jgi:hypothetical protein